MLHLASVTWWSWLCLLPCFQTGIELLDSYQDWDPSLQDRPIHLPRIHWQRYSILTPSPSLVVSASVDSSSHEVTLLPERVRDENAPEFGILTRIVEGTRVRSKNELGDTVCTNDLYSGWARSKFLSNKNHIVIKTDIAHINETFTNRPLSCLTGQHRTVKQIKYHMK